ncbi:MAG TPA: DUF433 domain-containing protein [Chloroflexia bacterium]
MSLTIETEPVPLAINQQGVVRVGGTRVTLDTVVAAFEEGATAEEIVLQYPVLKLSDVYLVIGYYLRHRAEVEAYLQQQQELADRIYEENKKRLDPDGLRDRLLARRAERKV